MSGAPLPDALAIRLRRDLGLTERTFDLNELALGMGFELSYEEIPGGVEGMSVTLGGVDRILIDPTGSSRRRQRFTLAHELGHCLLGHCVMCAPRHIHGRSTEPQEKAANSFAATLLMPPKLFREDARQVRPRMEEVAGLAESYQVSLTAAALRYLNLGQDSCALLGFARGRTWIAKHQSLEGWWIKSTPPQGSLIHGLIHGEDRLVGEAQVEASAWIENFHWKGSHRIREEVVDLGRGSWLVLLSEIPDPEDNPDLEEDEALEELERRRRQFRMY